MPESSTAAAPRPAMLTVLHPEGHRSRTAVRASPFFIGRQPDTHLVLRDSRISRLHSRITFDHGEWLIEDCNSRHGTYVNTEKIQGAQRLSEGDEISFGHPDGYRIVFHGDDQELARLADHVAAASRSESSSGALGKLRALVEVARALQTGLSTREVLEAVVDAALAITRTERGFLLLKKEDTLVVELARDAQGNNLAPEALGVPAQLIRRALEKRRELLAMHFDPHVEGAEQPDLSVAHLDLRSIVCIPLVRVKADNPQQTVLASSADTVGLLYLDSKTALADLSEGSREVLQTLALEASTVLENARLLEQERERRRLDEELAIARQIQQSLLPRNLPDTGWLECAASSTPSQQVGGDYYDFSQPGAGWFAFVVADVSGKGVSSGLLASLLQGALLEWPTEEAEIARMLARLNRWLHERTEGEKYATLFYGVVHEGGEFRWVNAGHGECILLHGSGVQERLEATSMPVGLFDVVSFETRITQLSPGDKIVIYSDGVSEAQNAEGQFFEAARIRELVAGYQHARAGELHGALAAAVREFTGGVPQRDDMTLLVVEFRGGAARLA